MTSISQVLLNLTIAISIEMYNSVKASFDNKDSSEETSLIFEVFLYMTYSNELLSADLDYSRFLALNLLLPSTADNNRGLTVY